MFEDKYQASVDMSSMYFYKELMGKYPDAKVILTVRDPQAWYESVKSTIWVAPDAMPDFPGKEKMLKLNEIFFGKMLDNRFEDVEHSVNFFNQHVEEVKRVVPQEKLFVFQVSEGWEPLRKFLGVDVPDQPFPSKNSKLAMHNKFAALQELGNMNINRAVLHS